MPQSYNFVKVQPFSIKKATKNKEMYMLQSVAVALSDQIKLNLLISLQVKRLPPWKQNNMIHGSNTRDSKGDDYETFSRS